MRIQRIWPALLLGLALMGLAGVSPADTAKADTAKIDKLVEQLGSDTFAERQEATAALAKIGMPALGALRKAVASKDSEVRKRAKDLLVKLEKEVATAEVLTPTKIHLVYKDTPLKEALEDLKKKTGTAIVLHDPTNKLKDKKITLDTGKTTFWDALDQFCDAAGVVEAAGGMPGGFGGALPPMMLPGVKIVPAPVLPLLPPVKVPAKPILLPPLKLPAKLIEKKAAPACGGSVVFDDEAAKKAEEEKKAAEEKQAAEAKAKAAAEEKKAAEAKAKAKEAAKLKPIIGGIRIQIGGGIAMPAMPIGPGGIMMPGWGQPGQITLVPGKRAKVPTDASSSIRVRIGDKKKIPALPNPKEIDLVLEVSPEPRLRWQSLIGVKIDKATDDNGLELKQVVAKANPNALPGFGGGGVIIMGGGAGGVWGGPGMGWNPMGLNGLHQYVPVKFEKGAKASKSLAELKGTISAYIQTPAEAMMTIDNLAKAKGKSVKGKTGSGELEIISYTKDAAGTVTVNFALVQPENVTPETQPDKPFAMPAMPPKLAPPAGGVGVPVRVVPAAGMAIPMLPMMNSVPFGLTLRDDKDNALPASIQVDWRKARGFGAPGAKMEFIATYTPAKGAVAEPSKLVFKGRKSVAVDIPFTLKKVPFE